MASNMEADDFGALTAWLVSVAGGEEEDGLLQFQDGEAFQCILQDACADAEWDSEDSTATTWRQVIDVLAREYDDVKTIDIASIIDRDEHAETNIASVAKYLLAFCVKDEQCQQFLQGITEMSLDVQEKLMDYIKEVSGEDLDDSGYNTTPDRKSTMSRTPFSAFSARSRITNGDATPVSTRSTISKQHHISEFEVMELRNEIKNLRSQLAQQSRKSDESDSDSDFGNSLALSPSIQKKSKCNRRNRTSIESRVSFGGPSLMEIESNRSAMDMISSASASEQLGKAEAHIKALEARCSKLQQQATEAQALRDELDTLRPIIAAKNRAESQIEYLKRKAQDYEELQEQITKLEERNKELLNSNLEQEKIVQKLQPLQALLDELRKEKADLNVRMSELNEEMKLSAQALEDANAQNADLRRQLEASNSAVSLASNYRTSADCDTDGKLACLGSGMSELNPEVSERLTRLEAENRRLKECITSQSEEHLLKIQSELDDVQELKETFERKYHNSCATIKTQSYQIDDLMKQIDTLREELSDSQTEASNLQRTQTTLSAEIDEVRAQFQSEKLSHNKLQEEYRLEKQKWETSHDDLSRQVLQSRTTVESLQEHFNQEIEALKSEHEQELSAAKDEFESGLQLAEDQVNQARDESHRANNALIAEYDLKISILHTAHDQKLSEMRSEHENAMQTLRSAHETEITQIKDASEQQCTRTQTEFEKQLNVKQHELEALSLEFKQHQEKFTVSSAQYTTEVQDLKNQLEQQRETNTKLNTRLQDLNNTCQAAQELASKYRKEYTFANKELSKVRHQNTGMNAEEADQLRNQIQSLEQLNEELNNENSRLRIAQERIQREIRQLQLAKSNSELPIQKESPALQDNDDDGAAPTVISAELGYEASILQLQRAVHTEQATRRSAVIKLSAAERESHEAMKRAVSAEEHSEQLAAKNSSLQLQLQRMLRALENNGVSIPIGVEPSSWNIIEQPQKSNPSVNAVVTTASKRATQRFTTGKKSAPSMEELSDDEFSQSANVLRARDTNVESVTGKSKAPSLSLKSNTASNGANPTKQAPVRRSVYGRGRTTRTSAYKAPTTRSSVKLGSVTSADKIITANNRL